MVLSLLCGCTAPAGAADNGAPFVNPLPAPASLRHAAYDAAGLSKLGREYGGILPHNLVEIQGDNAHFTPDWTGGMSPGSGLAYAVYEFALDGYDREEFIKFSWGAYGGAEECFIGLANWSHNRWDWYVMPWPMLGEAQLDVPFADYIDGGGRMLVAPLMIGQAAWELSSLRVGTPPAPQGWLHTWGGPGSDYVGGATTDAAGNLYICGTTNNYGAGEDDFILLKYSPQGELLWQKTWGTDKYEYGEGIALAGSGDIYLLGTSSKFATKRGTVVVHLNPSGAPVWQSFYQIDNGQQFDVPSGTSIDIDASGSVYVAGTFTTMEVIDMTYIYQEDIFAFKLDETGAPVWDGIWSGLHGDRAGGVAADGTGGCFVSGWFFPLTTTDQTKAALLKYNGSGVLDWVKSWANGTGAQSFDIGKGPDGTLFLGGCASVSEVETAALILQCDATGNLLDAAYLDALGDDILYGVLPGPGSALVLCGYATGGRTSDYPRDALVATLAGGTLISSNTWGNADADEYFSSGGLDAAGLPLLAGKGAFPGTANWQPFTMTYTPGISGTWASEATGIKDIHGSVSSVTGTLADVTGQEDTDTGEPDNVLVCQP